MKKPTQGRRLGDIGDEKAGEGRLHVPNLQALEVLVGAKDKLD